MKLSLAIIKKELEKCCDICDFQVDEKALYLGRPLFYASGQKFQSCKLYIVRQEQTGGDIAAEKDAACFFIGKPPLYLARRMREYLVLCETTDLFWLLNQITVLFDRYDNWESGMRCLTQKAMTVSDIRKFLECSSSVFENGLSVMDANYRIVAEDDVNIRFGNYPVQTVRENKQDLPREIVNEFKFGDLYQKILNETNVFFYSDDVLPHRCLCKNIFLDQTFCYRLIVTECVRPFEKTDEILLEYCAEQFRKGIENTERLQAGRYPELVLLLRKMIETGTVERLALESEIGKPGWKTDDTYRMVYVYAGSRDLLMSSLDYQCRELMRIFRESLFFLYQSAIIGVLNVTRFPMPEEVMHEFAVNVRENDFRAGFSNYFQDLFRIRDYYKQAYLAYSIGIQERPMHWIHKFSDVTFGYMLKKMTEDFGAQELFSPVYQRLRRYDEENRTEYVHTLQVYLEQDKNVVQTAEKLYVHRATVIYRLRRICEIGRTDLKNKEELLHLGLTFTMLKGVSGDGSR